MPGQVTIVLQQQELLRKSKGLGKLRIPKPPAPPSLMPLELEFFKLIRARLAVLRQAVVEQLIPRLPELERQALVSDAIRHDQDWTDLLRQILQNLFELTEVPPGELNRQIAKLGADVGRMNFAAIRNQMQKTIATDVFLSFSTADSAAVKGMISDSTNLIKTIEQQFFTEIEGTVLRNFRAGVRHEEVAKQISERFKVSEKRGRVIARDQTNKLNGALTKQRQTRLGISEYKWRTSLDERVRASHARLEGKTFSWDNPPIVDGQPAHPGQPIHCRCFAEPVIESALG